MKTHHTGISTPFLFVMCMLYVIKCIDSLHAYVRLLTALCLMWIYQAMEKLMDEQSSSECSSSQSPGDTLPWNLAKHQRVKRSRSASGEVLDPAERAVIRIAGPLTHICWPNHEARGNVILILLKSRCTQADMLMVVSVSLSNRCTDRTSMNH